MTSKGNLYKVVAVLVSLGMLFQIFIIPAAWLSDGVAVAEGAGDYSTDGVSLMAEVDNQIDRLLINSLPTEPAVLSNPITISRVQSNYQAGSTVVVSYTVTNNQPPANQPNVPEGATVTETVDILAGYDLTSDPNTMRNVTLATTLTPAATYIDSSSPPVQAGDIYTWTLADLPPQNSTVLTLTLGTPASAADFTDLDNGMTAAAGLWDLEVSDIALPAMLAPDAVDPATLQRKAEVDLLDEDMLWKLAEFTQTPLVLFSYAQRIGFDPYRGSLRGTRGTLWNASGNSLDQATLLITMLRVAGIPAQYRHGSLTTAQAQAVLATMFPTPEGIAGYVPSGVGTADPLNDAALIALAQDHWWVEAYLPGIGWTDLDPVYPGASAGQSFATPAGDGTDHIPEIPDSERHKVTIRLKVEQYNSFPIGGNNLSISYPLSVTVNTAEVAGHHLTLAHVVETESSGGMVYTTVTHSYVPYLILDGLGLVAAGETYMDLLSNFPLSSQFTSGQWLEFDVIDPDGNVSSFSRTVKDLIGLDARIGGGVATLSPPADNAPLVDNGDIYATWILPNTVPTWAFLRRQGASLAGIVASAQEAQIAQVIAQNDPLSPEDEAFLQQAFFKLQVQSTASASNVGLSFAVSADQAMADRETGLRVKQYFDTPRIFTIGSVIDPISQVEQSNVDLRKTDMATIVYPGQVETAERAALWSKGVTESYLEGDALTRVTEETAVTTYRIFEAMAVQGIEPLLLDADDVDVLGSYNLGPAAYAFGAQALFDGKQLMIPSAPVLFDGELTIGWWEIDPATGETIGVTEAGLHGAAVEYGFWIKYVNNLSKWPRRYAKVVRKLWLGYIVPKLVPALGGEGFTSTAFGPELMATAEISDTWHYVGAEFCPHEACGVEQFFTGLSHQPIPLPSMLFGYVTPDASSPMSIAEVAVTGGGGGDPAFTISSDPPTSTIDPNTPIIFQADISANFNDTFTVTVIAPDGWTTTIDGMGQVTAVPPIGAPPDDYSILLVAESKANPGLLGSAVHVATITALQDMAMTIVEEPNITIPAGIALEPGTAANDTNDGEAELTGMAFTVNISNTSTVSHTFDITVTGQPASQVILNGVSGTTTASVRLSAGAVGKVGLYVLPPAGPVPSGGTIYPVNVTATAADNPGLSENTPATPTVSNTPFSYLMVEPPTIYVTENSTTTFDISLTNVGNVAGNFPLSVTLPISTWSVSGLATPVALNVGQSNVQSVILGVNNVSIGNVYPLLVSSADPGSDFIKVTLTKLRIVSLNAGPIFETADELANNCTIGEPGLSAALQNLAFTVNDLEASCGAGSCSLFVKDEVVDALNNVVFYSDVSPLVTADSTLSTLATDLASHTGDVDIQADIVAISSAVGQLETEVCEISQHIPTVNWLPAYNAGLVDQPVSYTLEIENQGTVTTTYAVTVELPSGTTTFNTNLAPGETSATGYTPSGGALGLYDLTATARATGPDVLLAGLQDEADAALNVVDMFVQLTAVTADPNYVETGTSSTNISIDVANIANIPWDATVETQILASGGGVSYSADIPLTILVGNPKNYALTTVNTSGWAAGLYTVTVNLVDGGGNPITEGSGYGYFGVGQALGVYQSVEPMVVAPGTVTVTTVLTTEILAGTIISSNFQEAPAIQPRVWEIIDETAEQPAPPLEPEAVPEEVATESRIGSGDQREEEPITISASLILTTTGITRTEQDEPSIAYTGTWQAITAQKASSSGMVRADDPGDTAEFTFTGMEVSLGFIGGSTGAIIEVFIDGASQGLVDLYRREDTPLRFTFDSFITGTHTISFTHSGTTNPNATNDWVQFDYFDVRDGMLPPDGTFEQDDTSRVFSSNTWSTLSNAAASGGTYYRDQNATIWFPFSGDTVSYQYITYNSGGVGDIYIDNEWVARVDQYSMDLVTETISFDGLGPGFHMMMVTTYRNNTTVDTFATPGTGPFYTPITPTGFTRFEDDDPALLYNGQPFTVTNPSWTRQSPILASAASDGQYIYSNTLNDTVSMTFDGVWVSVGFYTEDNNGLAEIFVDGVSQGIIDTYSNEDDVTSFTVNGLITGTHTISVTVLDSANPLAANTWVNIDYIDVWDGTGLGSGTVEQDDPSVFRSAGLLDIANPDASGGTYMEEGLNADTTVWFPFEGDSITYQALDYFRSEKVAIYIDEQLQGYYEIYTDQAPTITHSFDGLGSGLHMIKIRHYRDEITLDAFITPAIEPSPPPPTPTTFTRYEEDAGTILYDGLPYNVTDSSWNRNYTEGIASDGQYYSSSQVGNSISFDFDGSWVGLGFFTDRFSGQVEIFIDGASQGILDLYTRDEDVLDVTYSGLADTNHTLSMTLQVTNHPNSSGTAVKFDYYETWDGAGLPAGTYEEISPEVKLGDYILYWDYFVEAAASGGQFINDGFQRNSTAWFPFTGDSVTFLGLANSSGDRVQISIDGVVQGTYNLYNNTPVTRAFTFDGLGAGPHMMQVQSNRSEFNLDAFVVPGIGLPTPTPVYTGLVRYEEDHADLVYNGQWGFEKRPQSWNLNTVTGQVSGRWHVNTSTVSDTVSLEFFGSWAAVGFRTRNQVGTVNIFVDGVNMGLFDVQNPGGEDATVIPIGGLITGTHTISVSVASGAVFFDYFDIWDGQPVSDDLQDLKRSEDNPRLHYSASLADYDNDNAIEGSFMGTTLLNTNSNIWYTFVGDSFEFLGFSRANTTFVELYVDGVFIETIDVEYPFSQQPISFHYDGFGPGPHVVRIHNGLYLRADAFKSNPPAAVPYAPIVEWYDNEPAGNGAPFFGTVGIAAGMAAGDVTGDGNVEIVLTADDLNNFGTLFVYRGDGQDTGDGDPILWSVPFGGGVYRTWVGAPALADLDGQPGSEIVVNAGNELYALHGDGSTYWITDTVAPFEVMASPAIANLDLEPSPEIVVNVGSNVYIFEHDGQKVWETTLPNHSLPPVLADMTGDGQLDIFLSAWDDTVYLYDYNFGSPTLEWSVTMSSTLSGMFGSAAVGDIDGQQPGGDDGPEIAVSSFGLMTILDADGSVVWSTPLDPGNPGGVSIADTDGDGEVEIIVSMRYDDGTGIGRIYALNADGTILWDVPAYDSSSANASSVLDLDGDGIYEVAWNGKEDGFTIFNGADGSVLFNEPLVFSLTGTDYSVIADVDLDGYAEVVASALGGVRVFGMDGAWTEARPLWNQYNYHITNINDDLTIPFSEANSWDVHNTYRTQWPEAVVLPVYDITLTHTVGITGVAVISSSFSVSPTNSADPVYGWNYTQSWANTYVTRTFDSVLTGLQPGESRLVAQGTEAAYDLPSGINYLTLPPMYVSVPHIISVAPVSLTVGAGGTAVFDVVLDNPALAADTYTLTVAGLTGSWLTYPAAVPVGAGSQVTVSLTVDVPDTAALTTVIFSVIATNSGGGQDQAGAELIIIDGLDVAIDPDSQSAEAGTAVTYTLTVSNYQATAQTYSLTAAGGASVTLPPTVTIPAGSSASLPVSVSAATNGTYPFTISADNDSGADSDSAVLEATGDLAVGISLAPPTAEAGPLTPAVFTVTVTNLGNVPDTYDLDVSLPAGWTYEFRVNGSIIDSLALPPSVFNSADVLLLVTPSPGASPGNTDIGISATSQLNNGVSESVTGTVDVQNRGVDIAITPQSSTMLPTDTGIWQVTITNTGSVADSYWLTMTGFIGPFGSLASNPVALNAGQSTTVQLTADNLDFMLPGTYQFAVAAESQNNTQIQNEAIADVTFQSYEAVDVDWIPVSQTVTDTLTATYIMVISNTGNVATTYDLGLSLPVSLTGQLAAGQLPLPAHVTAYVVVDVQASGAGTYLFDGTADSTTSPVTDSSTATLEVVMTNLPPSVDAGGDETADEGELINFNGTASDPEGQSLEILWDFGDGNAASGTLTPTHAYNDNGIFIVTLIVTDDTGLSSSDTLTATINNVAPTVDAGANQNAFEGDTISLDPATFSDSGTADTHTATINWGDGTVEAGTVNQGAGTVSGSHVYGDNGSYTVTVIVNDDDGGQGSDSFSVTIANVAPQVTAGNDQTADEGDTVSLDPATFIDSGGDDTHTATIDWGDGTVEAGTVDQAANTVSGSHAYQDNGIFTVTVTVTDDDGGSDSDTFSVTVNNVAPTVNAGVDQNVNVGDTVSLDPATFTDPGGDDTHTAMIDWGDGTVEAGMVNQGAGTVSGSHVYTAPGTYTVTVTVIDDDGGQSSDTFTVIVTGPTVFYNYVPAVYK